MSQLALEGIWGCRFASLAFQAVAQPLPVLVALAARRTEILDGRNVCAQLQPRFILVEVSLLTVETFAPFAERASAVVDLVTLGGEPVDRRRARRSHCPQ